MDGGMSTQTFEGVDYKDTAARKRAQDEGECVCDLLACLLVTGLFRRNCFGSLPAFCVMPLLGPLSHIPSPTMPTPHLPRSRGGAPAVPP